MAYMVRSSEATATGPGEVIMRLSTTATAAVANIRSPGFTGIKSLRLSKRKAELRAAGRIAYYDGAAMDRCPVRLRARMLWQEGWLGAQREVDEFVAREVRAAGAKRGVTPNGAYDLSANNGQRRKGR